MEEYGVGEVRMDYEEQSGSANANLKSGVDRNTLLKNELLAKAILRHSVEMCTYYQKVCKESFGASAVTRKN